MPAKATLPARVPTMLFPATRPMLVPEAVTEGLRAAQFVTLPEEMYPATPPTWIMPVTAPVA